MKLIDTHAHLHYHEFENQDFIAPHETNELMAKRLVDDAKQHGVTKIVNVGTNLQDSQIVCHDSSAFPNVFPAIGVHPRNAEEVDAFDGRSQLENLVQTYHPVAIGEIGLDYYEMRNTKEAQFQAFEFQLELAKKNNLPVLIHSRDAFDDTLDFLKKFEVKGLIHSFTYNLEQARKFVDIGFFIAFNGIVTFKNAQDIQTAAEHLPLESMILETDSPFLSPEPERGKLNEPAKVRYVAQKIAGLRGVTVEEVAEATTKNAESLLGI